jgi:adenylyltransferase and sulfurtransferase
VNGCLQALETIKVATRVGEPLCGRMLLFDALSSRFKTVCHSILYCMYTVVIKPCIIIITILHMCVEGRGSLIKLMHYYIVLQVNKIHKRSSTCTVCGDNPDLTQDSFVTFDYDSLTQSTKSSKVNYYTFFVNSN